MICPSMSGGWCKGPWCWSSTPFRGNHLPSPQPPDIKLTYHLQLHERNQGPPPTRRQIALRSRWPRALLHHLDFYPYLPPSQPSNPTRASHPLRFLLRSHQRLFRWSNHHCTSGETRFSLLQRVGPSASLWSFRLARALVAEVGGTWLA